MDKKKRLRLEAKAGKSHGGRIPGPDPEETTYVDLKLALSRRVRQLRQPKA